MDHFVMLKRLEVRRKHLNAELKDIRTAIRLLKRVVAGGGFGLERARKKSTFTHILLDALEEVGPATPRRVIAHLQEKGIDSIKDRSVRGLLFYQYKVGNIKRENGEYSLFPPGETAGGNDVESLLSPIIAQEAQK